MMIRLPILTPFFLRNTPQEDNTETLKKFKLKFRRSPVEILSTDSGKVSGIKFEMNNLIEVYDIH